jgi:hypothetical protein
VRGPTGAQGTTGIRGPTGPPGTAGTVANAVATAESTSSTTYVNLTTAGPSVTVIVPASGRVLVSVTTATTGNSASTSCLMSFAASGGNTVAASDANAVILAGQALQRASATSVLGGLAAASTTFTAQYRVAGQGSASCTYSNRSIMAIPLP